MKVQTLGSRPITEEQPRSTAYYYADLERFKSKQPITTLPDHATTRGSAATNEIVNDAPIREVPPLRDRQFSLPEYHTPENRKEETYSTAGTFPMPEPKEKEPLLAELEVVGRLPLTQLESSSGVRRSRSWYLCCPNVADEEISRESSWRYSSLRPVTSPPMPSQNGLHALVSTSSDDVTILRAERDALARKLAAERAKAAEAARAHDARLAELHGVIAELVRRRAQDKHAGAIPEEEGSDECESTTQPAGEQDNDADAERSRTDMNDSSPLSPDLPTPQAQGGYVPDTSDTSSPQEHIRVSQPALLTTTPADDAPAQASDDELCLNTARCCQVSRRAGTASSAHSCEREHGSLRVSPRVHARTSPDCHRRRHCTDSADDSTPSTRVLPSSPGRSDSRQAKLASRVRLRRTEDTDNQYVDTEEQMLSWSAAAERLASDVRTHADLREALVAANNDGTSRLASLRVCRARCARLEADVRVLRCALATAVDTAHKYSSACAAAESSSVCVCSALRCADRALEVYDVLLALAETQCSEDREQRLKVEAVASEMLSRLEHGPRSPAVGEELLSPGPWLRQHHGAPAPLPPWSSESESKLRAHAARLKADTVRLRNLAPPPTFFTHHDGVETPEYDEMCPLRAVDEMEEALKEQELQLARELSAVAAAAETLDLSDYPHCYTAKQEPPIHPNVGSGSGHRAKPRHWLHTASETDL